MSNKRNEPVPGVPGLYMIPGKKRTLYFCQPQNKYTPLGYNLEAAKAALAELMEAPTLPGQVTVKSMCEGFIALQKSYLKSNSLDALAPRTVSDYEKSLTKYIIPKFGKMHPDTVTKNHIAQYLFDGRETRRTRVNRERAAFSSAFNYGMAKGLVKENPCVGVPRNRERPRKRNVTIAELNAFLKCAREANGSLYMVALIGCMVAVTGRRRAEILGLTKAELLPEGIHVKDCKTKFGEPERFYLIGWSDVLRSIVTEAAAIPRLGSDKGRAKTDYLFGTRDRGTPYTDSGFVTVWRRLMHKYAPEGKRSAAWFTAHDLRALYVTNMLKQKRDPNTHKNEQTMRSVYDRDQEIQVSPLA